MKPHGVGGIESPIYDKYLSYDWYKALNRDQLEAYIRYLFIALSEHAYDVDARAQKSKRVHWDGGVNNYGCKQKCVWAKIADAIRANDAVPGTWIAAHFSPSFHAVRIAENKGYVSTRPELICSPDVYSYYLTTFDSMVTEQCRSAEFSMSAQITLLQKVIQDPDDLMLYIVADKTHFNATPFFRHAFAAHYGCDRGVSRYIVQAAIEYDMNQQLYDDLALRPENEWWISDNLKKVVSENRKYWSKYRG